MPATLTGNLLVLIFNDVGGVFKYKYIVTSAKSIPAC